MYGNMCENNHHYRPLLILPLFPVCMADRVLFRRMFSLYLRHRSVYSDKRVLRFLRPIVGQIGPHIRKSQCPPLGST